MAKISIRELNLYYNDHQALRSINLDVDSKEIMAVIGPANSGKSSLLRALNRLYEIDYARITGKILLEGQDIFDIPINGLRRRIGIVFATPAVLPGSIRKNLSYGPRLHRRIGKA
jgi:phosphate transport system ATP-binding protein